MDGLLARDVPGLRRGCYGFMRRYAPMAWMHLTACAAADGERWEVVMPPKVAALPEPKRFRTHARQEAQRLAEARLYRLCPRATEEAVLLGGELREKLHEPAVARSGRRMVFDSGGIEPPSPAGFLCWADPSGVADTEEGTPIVAVHWGPVEGGSCWLAFWSDSRVMVKSLAADARAGDWQAQVVTSGLVSTLGPLWYHYQQMIIPQAPSPEHPPASRPGEPDGDHAEPVVIAMLYTALASWWLLGDPPPEVRLTESLLPAGELVADRKAGLRPAPSMLTATAEAERGANL